MVAVAAAALLAGLAAPAQASSRTSSEGGQASTQWIEYDPDDSLSLPGNTHVGNLYVFQQADFVDLFGSIDDWDCDPGEVPGYGGHGEEGDPEKDLCDLIGTRFLEAESISFALDARARTASLTGKLRVTNGGHGEPGQTLATPPVDMTWTGIGRGYRFSRSEFWSDGQFSYRSRVRGTGSEAAVGGRIGAMGFTDDADDESFGSFETWRETSRFRVRG